MVLDLLGYIPVIGIFADIANGIWYINEGNYFCAATSFIAALPLIGDAFGITAEGAKYACYFNKFIFGTRAFCNLATFGRSLSQISAISQDLAQKHIAEGKDWDLESTLEVLTGLGYIFEALSSASDFGNNLNGFAASQCFVAGTLVLTIDGNKPIEEIKAGDLVYSTNPETGESEYKEVVRAFRKESNVLIHIFVNGEEIETTPNHPFWVEEQWVLAKDLREGDVLTLADGTIDVISNTYAELLEQPVIVYNFEVQDFHTYYVTDLGVFVHNASKYVDDGNTVQTDSSNDENTSDVEWTAHNHKHFPTKNTSWKDTVKSTKNGPAKYSPNIHNIEDFERDAWQNGTKVTNGKNWKVNSYDHIIGATEGMETPYVRIENSGNVIHGHPISEREYHKLLK